MNDIYYSLLSREELVEKNGGALLPLRTEPLASAAQFHEMSPDQQQRAVQLQRNQQDDAEFGQIEICLPKTLYIEAIIFIYSDCNDSTNPRERAERFIADQILRKYDDRQNPTGLVTYAIIFESSEFLQIAVLLCARAFPKAVIADIGVHGNISVSPIPYFTEINDANVRGFFSRTELEPSGRPNMSARIDYLGDSTSWAQRNRICMPLPGGGGGGGGGGGAAEATADALLATQQSGGGGGGAAAAAAAAWSTPPRA
jgi:hypothetical protein